MQKSKTLQGHILIATRPGAILAVWTVPADRLLIVLSQESGAACQQLPAGTYDAGID
jgi:hypothetical protein